jgi:uncharacterized protein (TIGR00255 family)
MTGFARIEGGTADFSWTWEARSVNGRNLDIRVRYPQGLELMDGLVRAAVASVFRRGSVTVTLSINRSDGAGGYSVNRPLLRQLMGVVADVRPDGPISVETLLAVRGVVEQEEQPIGNLFAESRPAVEADLTRVVNALAQARVDEGRRLALIFADQVNQLQTLAVEASEIAELQPHHIREKLSRSLRSRRQSVRCFQPRNGPA